MLSDWWPSYKEQASKEKQQKDESVRERVNREKNSNDVTAREQAAKDRLAREQAAREQAARERAAREQAAREQASKEEAARQQAAKDRAAREQAAKDRLAREQTSREQAIKDRLMREQAAWDQGPVQSVDSKAQPQEPDKVEPVEMKPELIEKETDKTENLDTNEEFKKTQVAEEEPTEKLKGIEEQPVSNEDTIKKESPFNKNTPVIEEEAKKQFFPVINQEPVKQSGENKIELEKKNDKPEDKAPSVVEQTKPVTQIKDKTIDKSVGQNDNQVRKPEAVGTQPAEKASKSLMASSLSKIDFSLNSPVWLVAVGVVGLVLLYFGFSMLFNRPKAEVNYPVSPWPMYRYDARHTGLSPFTGPKKPKLAWNYRLESAFKNDPLIAVDGRLYVVAKDSLCLVKTDGTLEGAIRLQKAGGSSSADPELNAPVQGVALSEKYSRDNSIMYVVLSNNRVAIAQADGTVLKTCLAAGHVLYSPVLGPADVIYIVSQPSKHHIALEAISPFGIKMWAYQVEAAGTIVFTPPAVDGDGSAYVGGSNGNVYAVNFDGSEKWTFQADGEIDAAPAIGRDGTLYVSSKNKLYAIDPESGTEQWSVDLPNAGAQSIGVDSTIYVATMATMGGGKVYAFTPDGTKKWEWQTSDNLCTAPVIGGDSTIYVGSEAGKVYAINKDGKQQWELQAAQMPIISSPIIGVGNTIIVWSGDSIYSIQEDK
ncbi:MAG: PQQ-binding-like beta-propeller repeat protein [Acidobacteriota bacterium]